MPTADGVRAAVDAYAKALSARDRDAWVACFCADATHVDPVPSAANVGREAIGKFWDGLAAMAERFSMDVGALHVCGDEAAVVYTLTLGPAAGGGMAVDGVGIFTVDDESQITLLRSYWDPSQMRRVEAPAGSSPLQP